MKTAMVQQCLLFLALYLLTAPRLFAQGVAINEDGSVADTSAMLDVKSTTKGLLIPRMTSAERTAIPLPATGLMVFDNTTTSFWYYTGSAWTEIGTGISAFMAQNNVVSPQTSVVNYGLDDFVFGSTQLDGIGGSSGSARFFFDKSHGTFRAGQVNDDEWDAINRGRYSMAFGLGNIASGYASAAWGDNNTASGQNATTWGQDNIASGYGATTWGDDNTASDQNATAWGRDNTASGDESTVWGHNSTASNNYATAFGYGSTASSYASTAWGQNNTASQYGATAWGADNTASGYLSSTWGKNNSTSGNFSTAFGHNTTASGHGSTVWGLYGEAPSYFETTMGLYPTIYAAANASGVDGSDRLFTIGNGTSDTARSNALTIYKDGRMSINDAYEMPVVDGDSGQVMTTDGNGVVIWENGAVADDLGNHIATQSIQLNNNWISNDGDSEGILVDSNGNVGVNVHPEANFHVSMGPATTVVASYTQSNSQNYSINRYGYQTFTMVGNKTLEKISLNFSGSYTTTVSLKEHATGTVLGTTTITSSAGTNWVDADFSGIALEDGVVYQIYVDDRDGWRLHSAFGSYSGGFAGYQQTSGSGSYEDSNSDYTFQVYVSSGSGFRVEEDGVSIQEYKLPATDGTVNQVLQTDGSGTVSWGTITTPDDLGNHTATTNIQTAGHYISNDGDDEGIYIDGTGQVGIGTNTPTALMDVQSTSSTNHTAITLTNEDARGGIELESQNATNAGEGILNIGLNTDRGITAKGTDPTSAWFRVDTRASEESFGWHWKEANSSTVNKVMTLTHDGNLGIGETDPSAKLHVKGGSIRVDGGSYQSWGAITLQPDVDNSGDDVVKFLDNTGSETMRVHSNGCVGIGTSSPSNGLLEVSGSVETNVSQYSYLTQGGSKRVSSGNLDISIYADNWIVGYRCASHSDARIKTNRSLSNSTQDLATLMDIRVTDYQFVDQVQHGDQFEKKVIAQELKEIYPQAVINDITKVVPDIMQFAPAENGWVSLADHGLNQGDIVRLVHATGAEEFEVLAVRADAFQVAFAKNEQLLVYGRQVDDFHTVDYDAVAMLNVSATQAQQKLIEEQKELIEQQQLELEGLKAAHASAVSALKTTETRLKTYQATTETRLQKLEALLQMSASK